MNKTETVIRDMMLENTGKALCDSGGAYGRNWEQNREKGFPTETEYPIEFFELRDGGIELYPTLNIYPFLINVLKRTEKAEEIEKHLYQEVGEDVYAIWVIEDVFKCSDFKELNDIRIKQSWVNTYNYMGIQSQILQFLTFEASGTDYILLQIHGGCDARGGYTKPRVFKIEDVYEFFGNLDYMTIYCECGEISWDYIESDYIEDENGNQVGYDDIAEKTYVEDGVLKCKECGEPILQTNPYF